MSLSGNTKWKKKKSKQVKVNLYYERTTSLTGLENITSIEGYVDINGNPSLINLIGLDNLVSIGSDLRITSNDSLTNLTGLENLTSINKDLIIGPFYHYSYGNPYLTSLTGLDNLLCIKGNLRIVDNKKLDNLTGLNNLDSIGGSLDILRNDTLASIAGLDNLDVIAGDLNIKDNPFLSECEAEGICVYLSNPHGSVNIFHNAPGCNNPPEIANACGITLPCLPYGNYHFLTQTQIDNFQTNYPDCTDLEGKVVIGDAWWLNPGIVNLNGLNVVTSIAGNLVIRSCDTLTTLTGLDNLISIGGSLEVNFNDALTNIAGLENVTSIGGYLRISSNDSITSLTGLDNIDAGSINFLEITYNDFLSTCEVHSVCDYLASPNGSISIYQNAPGCNSPEEVIEACATVGVSEFKVQGSKFKVSIFPNPVSGTANIKYEISERQYVVLSVFDIYGREIATLVNETQPAGEYTVRFDASDLPAGIYLIRLQAGNYTLSKKMIKL